MLPEVGGALSPVSLTTKMKLVSNLSPVISTTKTSNINNTEGDLSLTYTSTVNDVYASKLNGGDDDHTNEIRDHSNEIRDHTNEIRDDKNEIRDYIPDPTVSENDSSDVIIRF